MAATHKNNVEGPFVAEWQPMDVHDKGELVVTVRAIIHISGEKMEFRIEFISGASCQGTMSAHGMPPPTPHRGYVPGVPVAH